jgi:hypothetical protein
MHCNFPSENSFSRNTACKEARNSYWRLFTMAIFNIILGSVFTGGSNDGRSMECSCFSKLGENWATE